MALEKLLIFGFALAVMMAFGLWADDTKTIRDDQQVGYKDEIGKIVDKAK